MQRLAKRVVQSATVALGLSLAIAALLWACGLPRQPVPAQQGQEALKPRESAIPADEVSPGMLLFFDNRLSGDGSTSCATCHVPEKAWADGLPLSRGYRGTLYFRNTPTLINAGQMPLLDWDGRFEQEDMESLVRDHLAESHFLNIDGGLLVERLRQVPEYEEGFKAVFKAEVSYGRVLRALATFVRSLRSQDHPYLRYLEGDASALSPQAKAGLELFQGKAGCARCHSGALLSDGKLHALGVPAAPAIFQEPLRHITFRRFLRGFGISEYASLEDDPGLYSLTHDRADWGKFRTPSLLEVARTAPYMHNGVFGSLEEVVSFYNQGGGAAPSKDRLLKPLGLSEEEAASLVAFLESLGSTGPPVEAPQQPPYQPRRQGED